VTRSIAQPVHKFCTRRRLAVYNVYVRHAPIYLEEEMPEKVIEPDLSAATDECGRFNCNDEMDCCWHCGAHFSEPHAPDCKHADEPFDECDARPADPEEQADRTIWTASWGGTGSGSVRRSRT
jgi:hypothetical protein